jgi:hypothetical protein
MNATRLSKTWILIVLAFAATGWFGRGGQARWLPTNKVANSAGSSMDYRHPPNAMATRRQSSSLTVNNNELATESRKAIVETGMSGSYFDAHFTLLKVFDRPGDQRVVWKYRVNEYETAVNDAMGFYTDAAGKRIYTHSVKNILRKTQDITRTISKSRAQELMRRCLGKYSGENVELLPLEPGQSASLYLTANSGGSPERNWKERDIERPRKVQKTSSDRDDPREEEDTKKHPPIRTGYVNLETGQCTHGVATIAP